MTHDELLYKIDNDHEYWSSIRRARWTKIPEINALRAVVELHMPTKERSVEPLCNACTDIWFYPCPTIEAIEKALK